jgi:hypothetical protein
MNKATIATRGAVCASVLSALTASCCLAPAFLAALGFTATVTAPLTHVEPYCPYFTVGVLCLAAAGWWLYRRPAGCATGACGPPTECRTRCSSGSL